MKPDLEWPRILSAVSTDVSSPMLTAHHLASQSKISQILKQGRMPNCHRSEWRHQAKIKDLNKLRVFLFPTHRVRSLFMSSDEAEELLPATPRESFSAPVRKPPLLGLPGFVLNGGEDGRIKRLLQVLLREWWTLYIVCSPDLLCHTPSPWAQNWFDIRSV